MVGHEESQLNASIPKSRTLQLWSGSATLWAGVAGALAVAVYANALSGPFVYDDFREVLHNPSIGDLRDLRAIFFHYPTRPLTNLSYAIDFATGGLHPFQYHLTNVLLHVVNVLLLFGVARRLALDVQRPGDTEGPTVTIVAIAAASLFAVHPLMTEAVTFISSRSELLVATFCLASFYCFQRAFLGSGLRFLIAGASLMLLGLGAKETAVMLPAALLAYDVLVVSRVDAGWPRRIVRFYGPVFAVALLAGTMRTWWYLTVEVPDEAGAQGQHLLLALHVVQRYVSMLFAPVSQSVVPSVPPIHSIVDLRVITTGVVLGVAAGGAFMARKRVPLITFGLVWFALFLIPSSLLFLIAERGAPMAEHRVYLPSAGFFIAVGAAVVLPFDGRSGTWLPRARAVILCLAAVLLVLMALTVARNRVWAHPVLLWEDAVQKAPRVWVAHMELGHVRYRLEDYAAAAASYREAIDLLPDDVRGYLHLAGSLGELGRQREARQVLRTAVQRLPEETPGIIALAGAEAAWFNNPPEALRLCRKALAIAPGDPAAAACVARNERAIKTSGE